MAVSYRAAARTRANEGELVVVFGAGPIGIGAVLALRARGIDTVVSEPSEVRRRAVRDLGATHVLDPTSEDVPASVLELTGGVGAAGAIEAAGAEAALLDAVASTRPDGYVVVVASYVAPPQIPPHRLLGPELHITGSRIYSDDDFRAVISLMAAGHYPVGGWVETNGFDRVVEDGLTVLRAQGANKLLVDVQSPTGGSGGS
jgi:(R,R)-butanediol dehydrogenase/meso-butanediol dehydrogenase/diacetyl reductase